jgi:hypothetical protein
MIVCVVDTTSETAAAPGISDLKAASVVDTRQSGVVVAGQIL